MNPYTYSRARHMRQTNASPRSFWRDIVNAEISSVVALAVVIFAAGSAMTLSYLAGNTDAVSDVGFNVARAATSFANDRGAATSAVRPQVLGDSTTAPRAGQVVYNPGNRTVYLVGQNGLYGFSNAQTFYSWGFTFGQVTAENSAEQSLNMIGLVPAKQSGCSDPLSQINGNCGSSLTLPDNSSVRTGQLVYSPSSHTIYLVGQNALYAFTDAATFYSWGFTFNNILPANNAELALPVSDTFVPAKQSGCGSPLDQIKGTCGSTSPVAGPIKVLVPAGGEQWQVGTTQTISWDPSTAAGSPLTISIKDYHNNVTNIGSPTSSSGSFAWTIGSNILPGTYTLTISGPSMCNATTNVCYGTPGTSQSFTIVAAQNNGLSLSVGLNSAVGSPLQVTAGATGQKVASFAIAAPAASNANITSVTLAVTRNTIGNNFQNLMLRSATTGVQLGTTQAVIAANGYYTFNTGNLVVAAGTSYAIDVFADVAAGATAANFGVNNQSLVVLNSVTGIWPVGQSGINVNPAIAGQTLTLAANVNNYIPPASSSTSPTLVESLDAASPPASVMSPGQAAVLFTIVKFTSSGGDSSLVTVSVGQGAAEPALSNIKIYDVSTGQLLGSVASLSNTDAASGQKWNTVFFGSNWAIPNGTSKSLKIVADVPANATGQMRLNLLSVGSNNTNQQYANPGIIYGNYQIVSASN